MACKKHIYDISMPEEFVIPDEQSRDYYFVPTVTGGLGCYRELASGLAPREVSFGFSTPGYRCRNALPTSVADLALSHAERAVSLSCGREIVIVGWSTGGIIGWEVARQIRRLMKSVRLVLIDSGLMVGELVKNDNPAWLERRSWWLVMGVITGVEDPVYLDSNASFHKLNLEEKLLYALDISEKHGGKFDLQDLHNLHCFVDHYVRIIRRDYWPVPSDCPTLYVQAEHSAGRGCWRDWLPYVRGDFRIGVFPGNHVSVIQGINSALVANHITLSLDNKVSKFEEVSKILDGII